MASKVFADANLLLDVLLQRENEPFGKQIMQYAIVGEIELLTTPAVLHICAYWLTKSYGAARAKQLLSALLAEVRIIDCDHATALIAINSNMEDIEDALQYYAALNAAADYFISADKKLKKRAIPQLPVYTAAEFLKEIQR